MSAKTVDTTKELKWVAQYQGSTERDRYTYRATLFNLSLFLEKIPTDAFEFVAWLQVELDRIPAEYRDGTQLILSSEDCYECSSARAKFELYVDRQETDEEYADRMKKLDLKREKDAAQRASAAARKIIEKEARDKAEYERLKAKFGY